MTTITTRAGKGSPLTFAEADANFTNLNNGKVEKSGDTMTGALNITTTNANTLETDWTNTQGTTYAYVGTGVGGVGGFGSANPYKFKVGVGNYTNGMTLWTDNNHLTAGVGIFSPLTWGSGLQTIYAVTAGYTGEAAMWNNTSSSSYFSHGVYMNGLNMAYTTTGGVTPTYISMSGGQITFGCAATTGTQGNTITFVQPLRIGGTGYGGSAGLIEALAGQIQFPAVQIPSTNANTLDDYEEGTWTPTDNSGAGLVFTGVSARYIKIGKQVSWWCILTYPATASGANASIIGDTPFPTSSNNLGFWPGYRGFASTANISGCMVVGNAKSINLYNGAAAATNVGLSGQTIYLGGVYEAST